MFVGGASGEDVAAVDGQAGEDSGNLAGRFSLRENHFGHALPKGAMVIDLGEAQVFKGHVAEALDGFVGGNAPLFDLGEEFPEGF